MKTYKISTRWGTTETLTLSVGKYTEGNLAIQTFCEDGPYATLTVNLRGKRKDGEAYLDVNNFPEGVQLVKKYKLAEPTGEYGHSGFCTYPLYKFDLKKLGV